MATPDREDRLKAALKANMARRKDQKRRRSVEDAPPDGPDAQPPSEAEETDPDA